MNWLAVRLSQSGEEADGKAIFVCGFFPQMLYFAYDKAQQPFRWRLDFYKTVAWQQRDVFHTIKKGIRKIQSMTYKSGQEGKSTHGMAKKRRQSAVWIGVIGIAFVVVVGILLENSKALELGGIGLLVMLVLLRVAPGIIDKHEDKKLKEEKQVIAGAEEEAKDEQDQRRE